MSKKRIKAVPPSDEAVAMAAQILAFPGKGSAAIHAAALSIDALIAEKVEEARAGIKAGKGAKSK